MKTDSKRVQNSPLRFMLKKNGVVGKIKTIASDVLERERSEALKQVFETN